MAAHLNFQGIFTNGFKWVTDLAAGLIFIWIGYIAYIAIKHYKHQRVLYWGWIIAFIIVSLQVIAGAFVVMTSLNIYVALAHALFITCLFGLLSYFIMLLTRNKLSIENEKQYEKSVDTKVKTPKEALIQ